MITNAKQHIERYGVGRWRTATRAEECSRYFGTVSGCKPIVPGDQYFDTEEQIPVVGKVGTYHTCKRCGMTLALDYPVKKWA